MTGGTYGIQVTANNVDIDMKGFLLTGAGGGTYGLISGYGEGSIRGGVINRFQFSGIYLRSNGWAIEDMQVVRNGGTGIDATAARYIRVQKSLVAANGGHGAIVGEDAQFIQNIVSSNTLNGITCGGSCHVEANKVGKNVQHGISIASGLIIGNTINENALGSQPIGIGYYEIYGQNVQRFRTAITNNLVLDNCPLLGRQTLFVQVLESNSCLGTPC